MESQETNFLGAAGFGTSGPSIISDSTADLIFGGGTPTDDPKDVAPIEESTEESKKKDNKQDFDVPKATFSADDIFGEDNEESIKPSEKEAKVETPEESDDDELEANLDESEGEPEVNTFTTLTKNLEKLGIFSEGEDEVTTDEQFLNRWQQEKRDQMNQEWYNFLVEKHGEEGVEAFKAIFVNGVTPKDYLAKYTALEAVKDLDVSIEANQEKVYREYYTRQGWSSDKIEKKLQRAKDYGDLEDESKDLQELLIQDDESKLEQTVQEAARKEQQQIAMRQQYVNNLNTILADKLKQKGFDGIPVTDKVARETLDYLATEKWQLPSGEKLTDFDKEILELRDPKNHEKKVKIALLLRNGLDLSKVKITEISKEKERLFNDLTIKEKQVKRASKGAHAPKSFFDNL